MKFIFAENLDLVDPNYDFIKDRSSPAREPYWDDVYTHEILGFAPYDGLLVSKAIVGGHNVKGKYNESQSLRFKLEGARKFLRFEESQFPNSVIWGDCGAFTYANEEIPPYSVDEIVEYYSDGKFTHGCSLDHIIFEFQDTEFDFKFDLTEVKRRQEITLTNAEEFFKQTTKNIGNHFTPVGVVHGWSPKTMAECALKLVQMGYKYLALGGMVPLRVQQIKSALISVRSAIPNDIEVHILGFGKADDIHNFTHLGLNSFDTTSPLIKAFKDRDRNYFYWNGREFEYFAAIRVPQVLDSASLKNMIRQGHFELEKAIKIEKQALKELRDYDVGLTTIKNVMEALREYWTLLNLDLSKKDPNLANKSVEKSSISSTNTLKKMPWKKCNCSICKEIGIEVILFRGNNRNRRRGMHNLYAYGNRIKYIREN